METAERNGEGSTGLTEADGDTMQGASGSTGSIERKSG